MDTPTRSAEFLATIEDARTRVIEIFKQLPGDLRYHTDAHTLDFVYPESMKLAETEGFGEVATALY